MLAKAVGRDVKGLLSLFLYAVAILSSFKDARIAFTIYVFVEIIWLIPDRRIEKTMRE